jgi:hypothetical protein
MLDFSGSMTDTIMNLFDRALELVLFALQAELEVDIWMYTGVAPTEHRAAEAIDKASEVGGRSLVMNFSEFIHICNTKKMSRMNVMTRMYAAFALISLVSHSGALIKRNWNTNMTKPMQDLVMFNFTMQSTNLQEAVIFAGHQADKMNVQKRQIIILTDGWDDVGYNVVMNPKGLDKSMARLADKKKWPCGFTIDGDVIYRGKHIAKASAKWKNDLTRLIIDDLKKSGIKITGIGWVNDARNYQFISSYLQQLFSADHILIDSRENIRRSLADELCGTETRHARHGKKPVPVDNKIVDEIVKCLL